MLNPLIKIELTVSFVFFSIQQNEATTFFPSLDGLNVSYDDISKLLRIIQLRNNISPLPPQERGPYEKPLVMLDVLANHTCQVIRDFLVNGDYYKDFDCVEQDLKDLQMRLKYKDMVFRLSRKLTDEIIGSNKVVSHEHR